MYAPSRQEVSAQAHPDMPARFKRGLHHGVKHPCRVQWTETLAHASQELSATTMWRSSWHASLVLKQPHRFHRKTEQKGAVVVWGSRCV